MSLNQKKREDKPWLVLKLSGILTTGKQNKKQKNKEEGDERKTKAEIDRDINNLNN